MINSKEHTHTHTHARTHARTTSKRWKGNVVSHKKWVLIVSARNQGPDEPVHPRSLIIAVPAEEDLDRLTFTLVRLVAANTTHMLLNNCSFIVY